ncbi:PLC-like phosphodiesterase [Phyllosticta citriasiana]|uniref:PLC-like phosphodiesterase n=1 Tax=Phyllosticta citriasiana TaxID=595635 RepID=UPI0030FD57C6
MGQGMSNGYVELINATPHTWTLSHSHSYQMDNWSFPSIVASGASTPVYIQWHVAAGKSLGDDAGEAVYSVGGTSSSFQVQARYRDGFNLEVYLVDLATQNNAQGSTISLGWNGGSYVNWVLGSADGSYTSNDASVDWMHQNLALLGDRKIRHLCMPGSHDAGMSTFGTHTDLVTKQNTITQKFDIATQLTAGSRWFDIRPILRNGSFYTGHYSDIDVLGWQGADGQSLNDIISQINDFTSKYNELVILDISHAYNADSDYADFTQADWETLFTELQKINHRLNTTGLTTSTDLSSKTLSSFIENGPCVLLVTELQTGISLPSAAFAAGIVNSGDSFPIYNSYADSNDLNTMVSDQLSKLYTQRKNPDSTFFLLSWTLTQDALDVINAGTSILELAEQAYQPLFRQAFVNFTSQTYPNVLYMDLFGASSKDASAPKTEVAALAMAVNSLYGAA